MRPYGPPPPPHTGVESTHPYDALVLSPGAAAIKPPLPGVDLPGIFSMKTIPDTCVLPPVALLPYRLGHRPGLCVAARPTPSPHDPLHLH